MYSNGDVLEGRDYSTIVHLGHRLGYTGDRINGFVTSSGKFVLPGEAAVIAVESGQVDSVLGVLTPEKLWPTTAED